MRSTWWTIAMGFAAWLGLHGVSAEPAAVRALAASGAAPVGYWLSDWVRMPAGLSTAGLKRDAASVAGALGLSAVSRYRAGDGWQMWTIAAQDGETRTRVRTEWVAPGVLYLVADRAVTGSLVDLAANRLQLQSALAPYGRVHETVTLLGVLHRTLFPTSADALVQHMLAAVGARPVAAQLGGRWVVVEGYGARCGPPLAEGPVTRFNVQVTVHEQRHLAHVYVGQPVVTVPY